MKFQEFTPSHELRPYIHHYAVLTEDRTDPNGIVEKTPPSFSPGLLFYYHRESAITIENATFKAPLAQSFIMPHTYSPQTWTYQGPFSIFAILFKPGKLRYFFPFPLLEYLDRTLSLEECNDKGLLAFEDQILNARNTAERIAASNTYLLALLRKNDRRSDLIDWSIQQLLAQPQLQIQNLPFNISISTRHFRRLFERELGIAPKDWQMLARFTKSLQRMERLQFHNLLDLALECGYADQAQFSCH